MLPRLQITGVSRQYQSDEGLQSLLLGLNVPYPTTAVHIGRRVGHLTELVEAHNDAVRELEQVLTTYTKDGKLASKRPTKTIGGFMGCGGQKVDTIDYMTAKIKRLEDQVEGMRDTISDKKSEPYGFASFSAVPYAHVVARKLQKKRVKGCEFSLAPLPAGKCPWARSSSRKTSARNVLIDGSLPPTSPRHHLEEPVHLPQIQGRQEVPDRPLPDCLLWFLHDSSVSETKERGLPATFASIPSCSCLWYLPAVSLSLPWRI